LSLLWYAVTENTSVLKGPPDEMSLPEDGS
jgi:hypothetical protein